MNDKELNDQLKALKHSVKINEQKKTVLRNELLATPRQQSLKHAVLEAFTIRRIVVNNQAKLVRTGMLSMAVLAVGTLSVMGVYSAQFSPRAYAMRSIDSAYQSVQNKSPEELAKIQASLGMNPNDALAEARSSKNLREISKEDYDEIVANSSVRGNTLSADPNAPIIGFTSQDSTTIGEDESQPINVEDLGKYETQFGASVDSQQPTSTDMTTEAYTIELPEAKKFLRFTDQDGNDVILSLDVSNVPVFKTIVAN